MVESEENKLQNSMNTLIPFLWIQLYNWKALYQILTVVISEGNWDYSWVWFFVCLFFVLYVSFSDFLHWVFITFVSLKSIKK